MSHGNIQNRAKTITLLCKVALKETAKAIKGGQKRPKKRACLVHDNLVVPALQELDAAIDVVFAAA